MKLHYCQLSYRKMFTSDILIIIPKSAQVNFQRAAFSELHDWFT
ncbi:hypothetical protein A33Q_1849 [Indibacter alkaliphilus LW1]|uniref:Uncharacterized protein n=1 Tax=Indibacter alkaliphilus (strain CCUG 57479 / KCTC 22604 / LW1) TaxID=1189612 RepID=S2DXR8_INDAL|nr:hypothetical protein A33Q_1849 [Indibacter alkaliphilus LW1]